jgi:hypothetical protein
MIDATGNVLALLIAERDRLNQAIAILQGGTATAAVAPKRRGRPPGSKNKTAAAAKKRGDMSDAARKAVSARMKKYWAQRRKEKKG